MRRSRGLGGPSAGALTLFLLAASDPDLVAAHALGQPFSLPVPLWMYLGGAGVAVAASFVVAAVVVRPPADVPGYRFWPLPTSAARLGGRVLQVLGMAWWYGAILVGFVVASVSLLPGVLFWIGIWVGMPILAVLVGNVWPAFSPFRTTHDLLERGFRRLGLARLDTGWSLPIALGRLPAVMLLLVIIWLELISPIRTTAVWVAGLMLGYTVFTLLGMTLLGRVAWLRQFEVFEILFGWFGRVGPLGRRSISDALCADCTDGCRPERCIDCPECSAAADPRDLEVVARPWVAGLTEIGTVGLADAALIVLALSGVTFDGLQETTLGGQLLSVLFPPFSGLFGPALASFLTPTAVLVGVWLLFLGAFSAAVGLTRSLGGPVRGPFGPAAGAYAATLLPIAGGYLVAHYLTLVIQGAAWLPDLMRDPLNTFAPTLDAIPIQAIWYLSVGAIVIGHIAAVVLAHREALRDRPPRPVLAGLPLVGLMIAYTTLSLWIIAQPITIEPDESPSAVVLAGR